MVRWPNINLSQGALQNTPPSPLSCTGVQRAVKMGNTPSGASQRPNQKKILKQKVSKGSYEKIEDETSVSTPNAFGKSLLTVEKELVFVGSLAEDIGEVSIGNMPLKEDSFESAESKSSIRCPKSNLKCQFINVLNLEKKQVKTSFTGSKNPPSEMMDKKEDNIEGKKKGTGSPACKETSVMLPQAPNFPPVMPSNTSQLSTRGTPHKAETAATLLDGSQNISEKEKSQTFIAKSSPVLQVKFTKAQSSTVPSMDILCSETKNIKLETVEASDLMKTSPWENQPRTKLPDAKQCSPSAGFSYAEILKQSLPVKPPQKLSDARPVGTQQKDASVVDKDLTGTVILLGKGENRLAMQQTFNRCQETTNVEKQEGVQKSESIKSVQFSNKVKEINQRKSENLREKMTTTNPMTEDRKQAPVPSNRTVSPPRFTYTGEKPRYDWISPPKMPQEYLKFSGSCKTQAYVPEHSDLLHKKDQRKEVQDIVISWPKNPIPENLPDSSVINAQEQRIVSFTGTDKQGVSSKTCSVLKQCKSTQQFTESATTFSELGAIPKKKVVTILPQATDLQIKSASSKGHSSEQPCSQPKTPRKQPKIKTAPQKTTFPTHTRGKDQISLKHHISVSTWNKSFPPDPHIQQIQTEESSNCKNSDQSLPEVEKASPDELTTSTETQTHNIILNEETLDAASADPPHKIWKDFYVDKTCTKKCRCKHHPGKLPPNVTKWLSVSDNRLAEPAGITTLKLASSLVAGTKLLLDHTAFTVPKDSGIKQKEQLI